MGDTMQNRLYAISATFSILPIIFVALRFWARGIKRMALGWDDFMTVFALIACLATAVLLIIDTAIGGLGKPAETDAQGNPIYDETYWTHMKVSFGNRLSQVLAIGPTKISVLLFYRRVFGNSGRRVFENVSLLLIIICSVWTVAYFFGNLFHYMPIKMLWNVTADKLPPPKKQVYLTQCYIDVATDALIISLPIPIIWTLTWSFQKKIGVCCVFLMGLITLAASVARTVINYRAANAFDPDPDFQTYYLATITYWTLIEAGLGIIAACLPLLLPIVRKFCWVLAPDRTGHDDDPLNPKSPSPDT